MTKKNLGLSFACLSGIMYGLAAAITKIITIKGVNISTILFFRGLIGSFILFIILKIQHQSIKISSKCLFQVLLLSLLGSTATLLFLNASYLYLPVGSSTTIHFIYPIVIIVIDCIIERRWPNKITVIVLSICTAGVSLLFEGINSNQYLGIVFAVASIFTWSFYMIYLERSSLSKLPPQLLAFYQNITVAIVGLFVGLFTPHTFTTAFNTFPYILLAAVFNNVLASMLIQHGIARVGAGTVAILSVFEPLSSIIFGAVLLQETLSGKQILACALILSAITVMISYNAKANIKSTLKSDT